MTGEAPQRTTRLQIAAWAVATPLRSRGRDRARDAFGQCLFFYSGFFHFAGTVESGPSPLVDSRAFPDSETFRQGTVGRLEFRELEKPFEFAWRPRRDLAAPEFGDSPLVQLEFTTLLPWLIDEPQPTFD